MGMPLAWQQRTFQNLFQAALWPLRALRDSSNSPYTCHVTWNLRRLLGTPGEGFPLFFPNHELAFAYPNTSTNSSTRLKEGRFFPHLVARLGNTETLPSNLAYPTTPIGSKTKTITTQDLPALVSPITPFTPTVSLLLIIH